MTKFKELEIASLAKRQFLVAVAVASTVFLADAAAVFLAWAYADAIHPSERAQLLFQIAAFPILAIAPAPLSNVYFWELAYGNAFFLAGLVWIVVWRLQHRV